MEVAKKYGKHRTKSANVGWKPKEIERLKEKLPDLTGVAGDELSNLIPRDRVTQIVGRDVQWRILTSQEELLEWSIDKYNHCVATDISERCRQVPKERHPLHKYWNSHIKRRDFCERVHYIHNQVAIEGTCSNQTCVVLHLATVTFTPILIQLEC
jgi:hypothetical protein